MHASVAVGHERSASLALRENGAESPSSESVDGVVNVLDVRAADSEYILDLEVEEGFHQSVGDSQNTFMLAQAFGVSRGIFENLSSAIALTILQDVVQMGALARRCGG